MSISVSTAGLTQAYSRHALDTDVIEQEKKISLTSQKNRYLKRLAYSPATMKLFCALAENRLFRTKKAERKLFYARLLIMLYLHKGRYQRAGEIEEYLQSNADLKSKLRFTIGNFQPSGVEYIGRSFCVLVDARVQDLSEYLLSNIEVVDDWLTANLADLQTHTTLFFMSGSGPSPFNGNLNDVYLKLGHYRKQPHDREIVIHAVIHEIAHLYLRNTLGFRICQKEFGIRKFFDEGFAQLCGFRAVRALDRKCAHANTCAKAAIAEGISTLRESISNWDNTLFQKRYYPLYQSALSFVAYLEQEYGYKTLIELFRTSSYDQNIEDTAAKLMGNKFPDLLENWAEYLDDDSSAQKTEFFSITKSERTNTRTLHIEYDSDYPVYPLKDVLVCDNSQHQLVVSSTQKYRYQKTGSFSVECPSDNILNFVIAFDDMVQEFSMRPDL
ncbi:hypothetical protein KA005_61965 [bacterium]|nr:hypothetical protein [bacterium]